MAKVGRVILVAHGLRLDDGAIGEDAGQDEAAPAEEAVPDYERVVDTEGGGIGRARDFEPRAFGTVVPIVAHKILLERVKKNVGSKIKLLL